MLKRNLVIVTTAISIGTFPLPQAAAASDLAAGIIGGIIGGAIVSGGKRKKKRSTLSSGVSSSQRAANRETQNSLNYFGFPAGTPDGVMGRKSRTAIGSYQAFLGYPATGQLSRFERDYLVTSYHRAIAGGQGTITQAASMPQGNAGLLLVYRQAQIGGQVAATGVAAGNTVLVTQSGTTQSFVAQGVTTQVVQTVPVNSKEFQVLQKEFDDLENQITLLTAILAHQATKPDTPARTAKVAAIETQLSEYGVRRSRIAERAERDYSTPISPANANLGVTALRSSEVFPRVPYYIPGTEETGEMWIAPNISESGQLLYHFNFMDPNADYATLRESIVMQSNQIATAVDSFEKAERWTKKAVDSGIRKRFEKKAACFPEADYLEKKVGNTSTEIMFMLYEDGSTTAKVQRNKGTFSSGYNFSIESAMLLSAYLDFMKDEGEKEFEVGTMTEEQLDAVFD